MNKQLRTFRRVALGVCATVLCITPAAQAAETWVADNVYLVLRPPVGTQNGTAGFNCGWHDSCLSPYPSGLGLDWGRSNNQPKVIARSWGWREPVDLDGDQDWDDRPMWTVGQVKMFDTPSGCIEVEAQYFKAPDASSPSAYVLSGVVYYQHTKFTAQTDSLKNLFAAVPPVYNAAVVGEWTADNGCNSPGNHVHEDGVISNDAVMPPGTVNHNGWIPLATECRIWTNHTDAGCNGWWDVTDPGAHRNELYPERQTTEAERRNGNNKGNVYWTRSVLWSMHDGSVCRSVPGACWPH